MSNTTNTQFIDLENKEQNYQCWSAFFDLAKELLLVKNPKSQFGFHELTSINLVKSLNKKFELQVVYVWYDNNHRKSTYNTFSTLRDAEGFISYYQAQSIEKPIKKMLELFDDNSNQKSLKLLFDKQLWIARHDESFETQKNFFIDEKLKIAHETYLIEKALHNSSDELNQDSLFNTSSKKGKLNKTHKI